MRNALLVAVVVLLVAVVAYLALDRHEKSLSQERDKAFDRNFAK